MTKETLKVPVEVIGLLSIKSLVKMRGLINVSGFHVDPGFEGKLIFSMYNAGVQTIHLSEGSPLFLLWFCTLDGATSDAYDGNHKGQTHLPDNMVTNLAARMPSPFTVEKDMDALRNEVRAEIDKVNQRLAIAITLAVMMMATLLRTCSLVPSNSESKNNHADASLSPTPTPSIFSPTPATTNPLAITPKTVPSPTPWPLAATPTPKTPPISPTPQKKRATSPPQHNP